MVKKYLMFVDENGFIDGKNNFYMVGIIFEEKYCIGENSSQSSLKRIIYDNDLDMSIYDNNNNFKRGCILKKEIYNVLKESKFSILVSKINLNNNNNIDILDEAFNNLIKKYYDYLLNNGGKKSGVVVESGNELKTVRKKQKILNLYMDRDKIIEKLDNKCSDLINKFIIVNNQDEEYNCALSIAKIINDCIGYNYDREKNYRKEYRYSDRMNEKIMDIIHEKMFTEEIAFDMSKLDLIEMYKHLFSLEKKVLELEDELMDKEINIKYKNKEIKELLDEIKVLQHQLDDVILNANNNIIFEILSDVDIRIKNIAE